MYKHLELRALARFDADDPHLGVRAAFRLKAFVGDLGEGDAAEPRRLIVF